MLHVTDLLHAELALSVFIGVGRTSGSYNLGRMRSLMKILGDPQDAVRVVHVAGTSGKTSTAYYIAALLHASGCDVGLTVSPHIEKVSERAQINMCPLSDKNYCQALSVFLSLVEASGIVPSYFEVVTAFAFWLFEREAVDYAVVEVGIGGLLDATNVITRRDKICVITDIGYDHTEVLGNSIEQIAQQKAGIIHPGNKVFMNSQSKAVNGSIDRKCQSNGARLHISDGGEIPTAQHLPVFQRRNFALALSAVQDQLLASNIPLDDLMRTAAETSVPARMQVYSLRNRRIILDGSHNEQKLGALVEAMKEAYPAQSTILLVSFGINKTQGLKRNLRVLRHLTSNIICTEFTSDSGAPRPPIPADLVAAAADGAGFGQVLVIKSPVLAINRAMDLSPTVLVTGSFFLVSELSSKVSDLEASRSH